MAKAYLIHCRLTDWKHLPETLLLLSVNLDPHLFIYKIIYKLFLNKT
jgi:hypothetical protein